MTNKELIEENKRLEAWIDDLQSGMWINCVYCGHRYGPNKGNHLVTMRKALETHIAECPKHPLAMARNRIKALEAENERLSDLLWGARCVFCGEVIGKEKKNQDIADEVLRQHIKSCPKHPLTIARARIKELEHNLEVNGIDFSRKDGD